MSAIDTQNIVAKNGCTIQATFFHPIVETRAAVLIVPAMGVNQRYYVPFATWLATQGYIVATFDYSGTGLSDNGDIRKLDLNIIDWARFDCAAMINAHLPLALTSIYVETINE